MFRTCLVTFCVCTTAFRNAGSMRIEDHVDRKMIEVANKARPHAAPSNDESEVIIHVIGDTHGDNNYLLRCLESTKRVEIKSTSFGVQAHWTVGMSERESWEIVILGDIIDIGVRSRENLLILKSLAEVPNWGKRLVVLLGSHESMLLEGFPDYADGPQHWSYLKRMQDLYALNGTEGHSLITWVTQRPIVYFSHGLLMMHAGLSKRHADEVATAIGCQRDCGNAMQEFVNTASNRFYTDLHRHYLAGGVPEHLLDWTNVPVILSNDDDTMRGPGILWYKGWSSKEYGAGSEPMCREAQQVGLLLGPHPVMVVGHTTHPRIVQFCQNFRVPIFAVDTHPSECSGQHPSECDFDLRHDTHPKYEEIDYDKSNQLPQSLKMTQRNGSRLFETCYEHKHEVYCRVLRTDTFGDISMDLPELSEVSAASDMSDEFDLSESDLDQSVSSFATTPVPFWPDDS